MTNAGMKNILRSMIIFSSRDDEELFLRNYLRFQESGLGFDNPSDVAIWEFIRDFCIRHNHNPDHRTVLAHFQNNPSPDVIDRLQVLETTKAITRGDFERSVADRVHFYKVRHTSELFAEGERILKEGKEIQNGRERIILKGPVDALRYVIDQSTDIIKPVFGSRLSGEITSDGADFQEEYERVASDPLAGIGQFTGIRQIDESLSGAKRHELWLHAAFTGGLKSTTMINWAYNQSVYFQHSSCLFSLEMPYHQIRRLFYTLHSYNYRFTDVRMELGLQKDPNVCKGLPYKKIRDGSLSAEEEFFLKEFVIPDFNDESNNYGKIHIEVTNPDKDEFTIPDLRSAAERIYSKNPFSLLFIDHLGLVSPRSRLSTTTERQNEVLRDAKKLSQSFNRGQGIPVVALYQINREGFKQAEKNGGFYNLTHLSYANEAERSSDIVTSSYTDEDLRRRSLVRYQCLKSRDDEPFEPFMAQVDWPYRRIKTIDLDMIPKDLLLDDADEIEAALNAA